MPCFKRQLPHNYFETPKRRTMSSTHSEVQAQIYKTILKITKPNISVRLSRLQDNSTLDAVLMGSVASIVKGPVKVCIVKWHDGCGFANISIFFNQNLSIHYKYV